VTVDSKKKTCFVSAYLNSGLIHIKYIGGGGGGGNATSGSKKHEGLGLLIHGELEQHVIYIKTN